MNSAEKRLTAELKAAEDAIFDLLVKANRGDFNMQQMVQQLELVGNDIREGRYQIVNAQN